MHVLHHYLELLGSIRSYLNIIKTQCLTTNTKSSEYITVMKEMKTLLIQTKGHIEKLQPDSGDVYMTLYTTTYALCLDTQKRLSEFEISMYRLPDTPRRSMLDVLSLRPRRRQSDQAAL